MPRQIAEGQEASITIQAVDDDDLPITEHKGRFIKVKLLQLGKREADAVVLISRFQRSPPRWIVDLSATELKKAGKYQVWLDEVFGYSINQTTTKALVLKMPTREHPFTITVNPVESANLNIILGCLVGVVCAASVGLMLYYIRKYPHKAMKVNCLYQIIFVFINWFLAVVQELCSGGVEVGAHCGFRRCFRCIFYTCITLFFSVRHHLNLCVATAWDFFSDSYILFAKVLGAEGECKENIAPLVIPWLTCYAIATVVSVVALSIKAIIFRDQIRRRRTELKLEKDEQTDRVAKLEKHNKRLTKTKRQIRLVYSSALVGFFEYAPARFFLRWSMSGGANRCLPLGVLQIMYSLQCSGQSDMMSQLSLVTTWLMLVRVLAHQLIENRLLSGIEDCEVLYACHDVGLPEKAEEEGHTSPIA